MENNKALCRTLTFSILPKEAVSQKDVAAVYMGDAEIRQQF